MINVRYTFTNCTGRVTPPSKTNFLKEIKKLYKIIIFPTLGFFGPRDPPVGGGGFQDPENPNWETAPQHIFLTSAARGKKIIKIFLEKKMLKKISNFFSL